MSRHSFTNRANRLSSNDSDCALPLLPTNSNVTVEPLNETCLSRMVVRP